VQRVLATTGAKLVQLQPIRIVPPILLGGVIPFLALRAGKRDHIPYWFLRHDTLPQILLAESL
jgi:hypothetical protein